MRAMRILAVAVLAVVLALSTAGNAFASTELAYDDGPPPLGFDNQVLGGYLVVWFSLPPGWSSARLVEVRAYKYPEGTTTVELHVWGADKTTELITPITWDVATPDSWNSINLNVVVSGDFYVALKYLTNFDPEIGAHGTAHQDHSFKVLNGVWSTVMDAFMIRAYVDPVASAPVGGLVEPVNKLVVFAPYLALFGVLAVVVIAVVPWKKSGN